MENIPETSTARDEIKRALLVFVSVFGSLCVLFLCITGGLYGGVRMMDEKQKQAAAAQATLVGGYDIFDDFQDNDLNWGIGDANSEYWEGSVNVQDGMYVWIIEKYSDDPTFFSFRSFERYIYAHDFDLSVDGKLATPEADICYGVNFRDGDEGGYIFTVCNDRMFSVRYSAPEDGQDEVFQPYTFSKAIRSDEWNTLGVRARGDHFVLSINNKVVFEFTDSRVPAGDVYLVLDSNDDIPGTILFDNFGLQPVW
jgi:hypothetical protein